MSSPLTLEEEDTRACASDISNALSPLSNDEQALDALQLMDTEEPHLKPLHQLNTQDNNDPTRPMTPPPPPPPPTTQCDDWRATNLLAVMFINKITATIELLERQVSDVSRDAWKVYKSDATIDTVNDILQHMDQVTYATVTKADTELRFGTEDFTHPGIREEMSSLRNRVKIASEQFNIIWEALENRGNHLAATDGLSGKHETKRPSEDTQITIDSKKKRTHSSNSSDHREPSDLIRAIDDAVGRRTETERRNVEAIARQAINRLLPRNSTQPLDNIPSSWCILCGRHNKSDECSQYRSPSSRIDRLRELGRCRYCCRPHTGRCKGNIRCYHCNEQGHSGTVCPHQ